MVPDFHNLSILDSKDIDNRDRRAPAEHQCFHPPRLRGVIPLPAGSNEITFGDLKVNRATHRSIRPEKVRDFLLRPGGLVHAVNATHVVNDILGSYHLGDGCRLRREPDLLVKPASERLVLFGILSVQVSRNGNKHHKDGMQLPAEGRHDLIASHLVSSGERITDSSVPAELRQAAVPLPSGLHNVFGLYRCASNRDAAIPVNRPNKAAPIRITATYCSAPTTPTVLGSTPSFSHSADTTAR